MTEIRVVQDNSQKAKAQLDLIDQMLEKMAVDTEKEMRKSIANGPKSGRIYKRKGVSHVASSPGQPPANDTGNLASSISIKKPRKGLVELIIGALYAQPLEFGTSRMKARPFIIPALLKASKKIEKVMEVLFK